MTVQINEHFARILAAPVFGTQAPAERADRVILMMRIEKVTGR